VLSSSSPDYPFISLAAAAAYAAARLLYFHLVPRLPLLFFYLIATTLDYGVMSLIPHTSGAYFWIFLICEPAIGCIAALSVLEMFKLIFRDYPGLRSAGRWTLYIALALSTFIFVLYIKAPWADESVNTRLLFYELVFDRLMHFTLALVIMMQMYFLSRYPLHLDRNIRVASGFFSAMFLGQSVVTLIDTCFAGWGLLLQPASAPAPIRSGVSEPREAELLQQLESLNQMLTRSARR
jgi:hypothetical protein